MQLPIFFRILRHFVLWTTATICFPAHAQSLTPEQGDFGELTPSQTNVVLFVLSPDRLQDNIVQLKHISVSGEGFALDSTDCRNGELPQRCNIAARFQAAAPGDYDGILEVVYQKLFCTPDTGTGATVLPPSEGPASPGLRTQCIEGPLTSLRAPLLAKVLSGNSPPIANDDTITTAQDQSITFDPLRNDSDPDGDPLSVAILSSPNHGSAVVNENASITYTPNTGYTGPDSLSYMIDDGQGGTATAVVSITVTPLPEFIDELSLSAPDSVLEGQSVTVTVTRSTSTRASNQALSIDYRTVAGSADANTDFTPVSGTLNWEANETGDRTVVIDTLPDEDIEGEESFVFELLGIPSDVQIEASQITIKITDSPITKDLTPNQEALVSALDQLCPSTSDPDLQRYCSTLDGLSGDELGNALDSMMPDEIGAMQTSAINGAHFFSGLLKDRKTALRAGRRGVDTSGLSMSLQGESIPLGKLLETLPQELSGGSAGSDAFNADFGRLGVFLSGRLVAGEQDDTDFEAGYDFDTIGVLAGADYRISDQLVLGGALGYLSTDSDFNNDGGNLDTSTWNASVYGTYYLDSQWYVDGVVQYGRSDYDSRRNIRFADVDTFTTGSTDGDQFSISLTTGADFYRNEWLLSPYLGLDFINASIDRFSESGGEGLALTVNTKDIDILTSRAGLRISRNYSLSWGILSPTAFVEWAHEFKDDSREITSTFVADPSVPFTIRTDEPDRNYFNLGIGAAATFTEGRAGFINYEGRFGDSDFESHRIQAGIRFEF